MKKFNEKTFDAYLEILSHSPDMDKPEVVLQMRKNLGTSRRFATLGNKWHSRLWNWWIDAEYTMFAPPWVWTVLIGMSSAWGAIVVILLAQ